VTAVRCTPLVLVLLMVAVPATSWAADDDPVQGGAVQDVAVQDVTVHVLTLVGKARGRTDRELRHHRSGLRRLAGFRAYRLVSEQQRGCRWRSDQSFRLPNGRWLRLRPKRMTDDGIVMRVRIHEGDEALVDTDVRMGERGMLVFGMPRQNEASNGALLIMLKAGIPPEVGR